MTSNLIFSLLLSTAFADPPITTIYSGSARSKEGQVTYLERHNVQLTSTGDVSKASTEYTRESGEVFGRLKSDFSKSVTAPSYTFEDLRDGSSHGLEFDGQKYTLWKMGRDQKKESKEFPVDKFDKDALVVGCQGLHYYLVKNLNVLKGQKDVEVKYLIPGKLDYFSFLLNVEKEDDDFIYLTVKVQNIILRAFVSNLHLTYRKKDRRLIAYSGLSNIPTDSGDIQNVQISYDFDGPAKGAKQ
jgi:hypothetical protein